MNLVDLVWMRKTKHNCKRLIEIDLLRGLAILFMIFGHILWDLDYFGVIPMNNIIYSILQKTIPPLFFILVGMSLIVSRKKKTLTPEEEKKYHEKLIIRGLKIFNLGMFLTIFSLVFFPEKPVFFGVLHCIGLSIILSVPFLKHRTYSILFATIIIALWALISQIHIQNPNIIQLALGLHQSNIWTHTVDYFPLIPWFGVTLMGITIGNVLYNGNKRKFRMPDLSKYRPAKVISWIGQHSLEIYLIHQPLIAGLMFLFVKTF
jgi:uncharacterized membrane protein